MNIFYVHALAVVNPVPRVSQMSVISEREGGTFSNGGLSGERGRWIFDRGISVLSAY